MRLSQAWIIAKHDIGLYRQKRGILYGLVGLPLGVAVGFPLLVRYIIERAGTTAPASSYLPGLLDAFGFWFVIAAATLPVAIASYSIVGEKVEKSLEPLLATPSTDGEILLGKALAALVPTVFAIWGGSAIFMALVDRVTEGPLGYLYYPNWEMAALMLLLTPLTCLLAIEASILISARVTDVRSGQQYAGIIFLPFVMLYIIGEIGILTLNTTTLLIIAGVQALVSLALFGLSRATFQREEILTRWK